MSDGEWALLGVTIAIPLAVATGLVVAMRARGTRCPSCRGRLALHDDPRMLQCRSCDAEFRRDARGPLIRNGVELPRAKVHR
jgi:hypothetical protein